MNQPTFTCQVCGGSSLYAIRDDHRDAVRRMKADPASVETLTFACRQCSASNQIKVTHEEIVEIVSEAETTDISAVVEAALKMKKPGSS